jgi:small-conductance mechanosensitive channel
VKTETMSDCHFPADLFFGGAGRRMSSLLLLTAFAAGLILWPLAAIAQQPAPKGGGAESKGTATQSGDIEAESPAAMPVLLGGEPVVWIVSGVGPYTPQMRAERISARLEAVARDRSIQDPHVVIVEAEGSSELRVQQRLLMVITQSDATTAGVARLRMAEQFAQELEAAIRAERLRYAPSTLMRSGIYAGIATVSLAAILWLIFRLTGWLRRRLTHHGSRWLTSLHLKKIEIGSTDRIARLVDRLVLVIRIMLIFLLLDIYLTYVLGLFPWTRAVSLRLLDYLLAPLSAAGMALVNYLPKLLFVVLIVVFITLAIRAIGLFFWAISSGRIVFQDFPPEWAEPTNKIVRVLLIAFGAIIAYPYLPASDSSAFAGVSVFLGVLLSLASSTALSNVIAGLVLTYTGAFRLGDRVKIGDAFGDILKTSLLATRIRTIKNEEITIPNSTVLGSSVTNYSHKGKTPGLILHTSVTIGYDAPWRKVHDLLTHAALGTPGILPEPRPFVWQTALNDFYVTYEINAYTVMPHDMNEIYATLHARIQDSFYEAGVEIMSPHYASLRDGNTVAIPEDYRAPGYRAPGFRLDHSASKPD